ncbi:polysaccharide deacetylase family protein [Carnobacterium viridans]|uniref:Peptidoglycan/xylan/chitin deacetylase, PgdA/CDA1 family n=1 Tax=Carnobacterium viridans TaxID=174587 RepID=A0A1H0YFM9_9LACT|nr:polysaccharide deacetylase family protein [Carnobacterium viridans]UDE95157.1 polysaccharide deacetylase family protein [Carnobacterium viridans]SDQ14007.1 Peptidoglycan/xylan/chitin deacetylase, PgdA/CDA1 family [Carnobacterium viridans]
MKKNFIFAVTALMYFSFFSDTLAVNADTLPTSTEVIPPPDEAASTDLEQTATSDIDASETVVPETVISDTDTSETVVPETVTSDTNTPETVVPETATSDTDTPETVVPETATSDTDTSETVVPETATSDTDTSETVTSDNSADTSVIPEQTSDTPSATPTQAADIIEAATKLVTDPATTIDTHTTPSQLINQVNTNQKVISLTISGVSNDAHINEILQNLATLGVKATFFVNGSTSQAALTKIIAAGHDIGNHASTGVDVSGMTAEQLISELALTEAATQGSGATSTPYFRAPGGITNEAVLKTVGGQGYDYTIGWSIDPWDWSGISASEITSIVTSQLAPGSIILLDAGSTATGTPAALLDIITRAKILGYTFTTLEDLLAYEGVYTEEPAPTTPSNPINQVNTNQKVISLTISGVSDDAHIDAILQNLTKLGIKATFFVNGSTSQSALTKIIAAGHDIGNHASTGVDVSGMTEEQLIFELALTEAAIQSNGGVTSSPYFRAPGGITNEAVLKTVGSQGYDYTIGWSIDSWDWSGISASEITSSITSQLAPGGIILLDAGSTATGTPAALLDIVTMAQSLGYTFTTLEGLLAYKGVYTEEPVPTTPSQLIHQVNTDKKVISLTFDDGNDANNLEQILNNLLQYNVKATFFMNGSTDPALLNRIVAEGHQLGNHTYYHGIATEETEAQLIEDITLMDEYIVTTTGISAKPYFRFPAGYLNDSALETVGELGYTYTIGWTVDPWDWSGISSEAITYLITEDLNPGNIYLLHASDIATGTPAALLDIIPFFQASGYEFKTIEQLLTYEGDYTVETNDLAFSGLVSVDEVTI